MFPRRSLVLAASLIAMACRRGELDAPEPERRAAAVRSAGRSGELPVLLVAQRDPSALVRRAAAEAFAARGGPGATEALGALLLDADAEVAATAARGLAALGTDGTAREDLVRAYGAARPATRAAIADALDALGVSLREAVEAEARALWERNVAALAADAGPSRAGAAEEIGASARAEAVQRLLPLVDTNRNPEPALAAAASRGLAEAGDWKARPFLEALLEEGDVPTVEAAAAALARLGDPAAAAPLARLAADGPGRIASAAADALAALPAAPEVGAALCGVALRTRDPSIAALVARAAAAHEASCPERQLVARLGRSAAAPISALAELAPPSSQTAARVAALLDPGRADAPTRAAAARFLARTGQAASGAAVARRAAALAARASGGAEGGLAPEEAEELGALLAAAGRLRADGAEALLGPGLADPRPAVRVGAVEGLSQLGAPGAVARVAAALADPELRVRLAAAEALGRQGTRGAAALAKACGAPRSREPEWSAALARALGEAGSAEAVPALTALLEGESAGIAAAALARTGAPGASAPLAAYLARPDAPARAGAIEALAALGARDAAPVVAAQLTHDLPEVRAAAARALGKMRYEPASARLEALRSDYYGRVRRAAVEALAKLPAGAPRPRP
ncbi:HEAT repeat domain-containing protein [Anaeromyxobacter sp. Fw109-5]|uniref:HEAT repeat domain-containing protein n=1 Tax=Anaeromyxobacter sp. (strain Fw109-5) TaxID=404589 RepID=UPI000158A71D|nr:HEAT repeat domain-containing protein [Anaeromyxobacter sp. Fw109-5]ABS26326.1 PBS lyase HEAT domain protein repeat-containing protein [Anaeromyxobacter sp. Fw109-5]